MFRWCCCCRSKTKTADPFLPTRTVEVQVETIAPAKKTAVEIEVQTDDFLNALEEPEPEVVLDSVPEVIHETSPETCVEEQIEEDNSPWKGVIKELVKRQVSREPNYNHALLHRLESVGRLGPTPTVYKQPSIDEGSDDAEEGDNAALPGEPSPAESKEGGGADDSQETAPLAEDQYPSTSAIANQSAATLLKPVTSTVVVDPEKPVTSRVSIAHAKPASLTVSVDAETSTSARSVSSTSAESVKSVSSTSTESVNSVNATSPEPVKSVGSTSLSAESVKSVNSTSTESVKSVNSTSAEPVKSVGSTSRSAECVKSVGSQIKVDQDRLPQDSPKAVEVLDSANTTDIVRRLGVTDKLVQKRLFTAELAPHEDLIKPVATVVDSGGCGESVSVASGGGSSPRTSIASVNTAQDLVLSSGSEADEGKDANVKEHSVESVGDSGRGSIDIDVTTPVPPVRKKRLVKNLQVQI